MSQQYEIDGRTAELIQGALDGELVAAEQAELDALLSQSAAARGQLAEFTSLAALLDKVPEVEPPEYLKNVVLANVTLPVKSSAKDKTGFFSRWSDSFSMRSGVALTLAAVLIAGIYQMGSDPQSSSDTAQMIGTIVPVPAHAPDELTKDIEFNSGRLNGEVQLHRLENALKLDFSLDSDAPYEVRVGDLADTELRYSGVETADPERLKSVVSAAEQAVTISSQGKLSATLNLRQEAPISATLPVWLALEFFVEGRSVHQVKMGYSQDLKGFDEDIQPE